MSSMSSIIAVIPAFNEESRIAPVVRGALEFCDEVIVIDDYSRDKTGAMAAKAGATVIRLVTNMGAGMATRVGCDIAAERNADIIVTLDADGQHAPDEIPKLVGRLKQEHLDIVFGSRSRNKKMPLMRRIGNHGLSTIASALYGVSIKDSQTGFHAFTRGAYKKLRWSSNRFGMVSEFVANVGKHRLRYDEVKIRTIYTGKQPGMRKRDAVKAVLNMIKWRLRE